MVLDKKQAGKKKDALPHNTPNLATFRAFGELKCFIYERLHRHCVLFVQL